MSKYLTNGALVAIISPHPRYFLKYRKSTDANFLGNEIDIYISVRKDYGYYGRNGKKEHPHLRWS